MPQQAPDHTQRTHSPFGASISARRSACLGSYNFCKDLPSRDTRYSAEGTAAHQVLEWCLTNEREPEEFPHDTLDVKGFAIPVNDEMRVAIDQYLDVVRDIFEPGDTLLIEHQYHLPKIHEFYRGTSDCAIYKPRKKELHVIDYKHGRGVPVRVEGNRQLRHYGLGVAMDLGKPLKRLFVYIIQPRFEGLDAVQMAEVPVDELFDFAVEERRTVEASLKPDAPRAAGDHCRFCPGASTCPELRQLALTKAQAEFTEDPGPITLPDPKSLTPEQRLVVLESADMLKLWLRAVLEQEHANALAGDMLPGMKFVHGRSNRKWRDDEVAERRLNMLNIENPYTEPKLKSPGAIEKQIGKKRFASLFDKEVVKPPGKLQLVPLSHPGEPAKLNAAEEFGAIEGNDNE